MGTSTGQPSYGGSRTNYPCDFFHGCGTVFKITPSGTLTTLYSFCSQNECPDGDWPTAGLVQATNGDLYGTNVGTVFKITPSGTLTTYICPQCIFPQAPLIQATNGDLYGASAAIFKITLDGTVTTLSSLSGDSFGGLVQAANGDFYGTTAYGGNDACPSGCGTIFKITPGGTLTTLYSFCSQSESGCPDGAEPYGGLVQATNGDFYGTTSSGGANDNCEGLNHPLPGCGTIFKITPSGTLTTLYSFCSQSGCTDGQDPYGGLIQDTNGKFYGTTVLGGANGAGAVFSLSVGLGPFVKTLPTSGEVGVAVKILGSDLTGATSPALTARRLRSPSFRLRKSRPPYRQGLPPERSAW
jgi:uncharacterized repeat protein (TIGR03803 family)